MRVYKNTYYLFIILLYEDILKIHGKYMSLGMFAYVFEYVCLHVCFEYICLKYDCEHIFSMPVYNS